MRAAQLSDHVADMITDLFEADVAEVILNCTVYPKLVRILNYECQGDTECIRRLLQLAAEQINGTDTADWLVEWADLPAAFIISRIR